jgi:X box-binding protein 1
VASTNSVALQRVVLPRPSSPLFLSLTPWQQGKLRLRQRRPLSMSRRWRSSSGRFSSRYLLARR